MYCMSINVVPSSGFVVVIRVNCCNWLYCRTSRYPPQSNSDNWLFWSYCAVATVALFASVIPTSRLIASYW